MSLCNEKLLSKIRFQRFAFNILPSEFCVQSFLLSTFNGRYVVGSFHGRTDRAAQVSYATGDTYRAALATWLPRAAAAAPAAVPDDLPSETQPRRAPFDVDDFFRDPDNLERPFDVDDFFRDVENIKSERNNVVEREVDDAIPWDDASPAPPQRAAAEAPNPPCVFVQPNDVEDLRAAFRRCDAEGFFVEAMLIVGLYTS